MADSSLRVTDNAGVAVVGFRDASILDVVTIQRIGKELYDLVEVENKRTLVLDFADVRFLSSQALGVLLTLRRKGDKHGARIVLSAIRPELARVFKITNLDKLFEFFETTEKAVAALSKPGAG